MRRARLVLLCVGLSAMGFAALTPRSSGAALGEPQDSTGTKPLFLEKPSHEELKAKAAELLRKVSEDSTNYDLQFELAGVYYDMGSLVQAVKHYRKAVELDSTGTKALVNLGVVLNEMGKSDEAIDVYDKALARNPEDTKALCNRGLAYYALGDYAGAVNEYRRALTIDSKCVEAHYNLGVAFADAQIYREAIAEWKKVVELDPKSEAGRGAGANIEVVQQLIDLKKESK